MFDQSIADAVCANLAEGASLVKACEAAGAVRPTILLWVSKNPEFADKYAQARETGYKLLADEILSISDEADVEAIYQGDKVRLELSGSAVARNRLRVDTRKWMLSKMLPKIYGDKIDHAHSGTVRLEHVKWTVLD